MNCCESLSFVLHSPVGPNCTRDAGLGYTICDFGLVLSDVVQTSTYTDGTDYV